MAKAVGIDLGTTNSVIATMEGREPVVIANAEGVRTTPSVVAFTDSGERLVGQLARQAILNPKGTICSAKRFVGRRFEEVTQEAKAVTFDVLPGPDATVRFAVRDKRYAPEEISAAVLRKLPEVVLLDVIPLSLGLETLGGAMTKIIDRNTTIPVRRTEVFSTAGDNQPAVDVVVLQGERERAPDNRVLGRFRSENIRPAPRGVPQIEVTFDVNANGILTAAARDKDTGAEQTITVSGTSNLDSSEVDRMLADAEHHREEDARLRTLVDARNELEGGAYQVERRLADLGDGAPSHERARAEMLLADARQAIKEEAPLDRLRSLTGEVQQVYQGLMTHQDTGNQGQPGGQAQPRGQGQPGNQGDDDVIDADFT